MKKQTTVIATVSTILIIVVVLIIIIVKKNKNSGPEAQVDSATDSAKKASEIAVSASKAATAAANRASASKRESDVKEAAAATEQSIKAGEVAQQASASADKSAKELISGEVKKKVDCVLSDWGEYGPCMEDGDGKYFKTRLRTIKVQPSGDGNACESLVDKIECVPDIDCVMNDSLEFGPCTDEGGGRYRRRGVKTVKVQPSGNGKPCEVAWMLQSCVPDIDCVLSDWGEYGPCTRGRNGEYFQTRTKSVVRPPSGNGKACGPLVDIIECPIMDTTTSTESSDEPCLGWRDYDAPSASRPIPLECHKKIWSDVCSIPLNENDWAPNYRKFPTTTVEWLRKDARERAVHPDWKSHCNPVGSPASCDGYTAGSAAKPIPLQCHKDIWKKHCSMPLVESDWAPNYRTFPTTTVEWLESDAIARSNDAKWASHCRDDD